MESDLLDLFSRASAWTETKVAGATNKLDARTPCDEWDVRTLMNHMLDTQRYFVDAARGKDAKLPSAPPPDVVGDDPVAAFEQARADTLVTFGAPGVVKQTGISLGIASSYQLLHGWDLATATGQDATMPAGLAASVYDLIHGRFTEDQRKGVFKPEVPLPPGASDQDRLLAYTGRDPS
jgi:uncharacterized protein (TIGR03086 family)